MLPLEHERGFLSSEGLSVKEIFKDYFINEGAVSWQTVFIIIQTKIIIIMFFNFRIFILFLI